MSLRIVVSGLIGQHPQLGGMTWHYLQYVLGLRDLGHDVYYLEDSGEWPYNWDGGATGNDWIEHDARRNVEYLASVMHRFGLDDRWAYRVATDGSWHGLPSEARRRAIHGADLLLNISGSIEHPDEYASVGRRVYIDSDPVFTQLSIATTDHLRRARVQAHDVWFTFAADLSAIPDDEYGWIATRQPIVLEQWSSSSPPDPSRYTTVMNWTSYSPFEFDGELYGQKDVEFVRFLDLPRAVPSLALEIATPDHGHTEWERAPEDLGGSVHETLGARGWRVVDSLQLASSLDQYRAYIVGSRGEWSVAKHGYVRGRCGWFSERSACYLAAGRPVIAQDTGFSSWLPVGEGLLAFSDPDDAVAAFEEVEGRYAFHADAAREIAREYFSAAAVLDDLVARAGAISPSG